MAFNPPYTVSASSNTTGLSQHAARYLRDQNFYRGTLVTVNRTAINQSRLRRSPVGRRSMSTNNAEANIGFWSDIQQELSEGVWDGHDTKLRIGYECFFSLATATRTPQKTETKRAASLETLQGRRIVNWLPLAHLKKRIVDVKHGWLVESLDKATYHAPGLSTSSRQQLTREGIKITGNQGRRH
ncbi:hypothetical protein BJ508DRAFT_366487 [Ascobolus immersus RN42]|uniref:Uncharacterized protein n=1 Tax=Ascobolus immersus RN42 TaxID=1160509 RepID=A0A3N4HQ62_ASCIM|nr:hypothetical protein BJ508DRAFT_366487 [Ascobolus immersus RN42]